jgi:serine/threonine protein kinase
MDLNNSQNGFGNSQNPFAGLLPLTVPGSFVQPPVRQFRPPNVGDIITFKGRRYYLGQQFATGFFGAIYECTDDWGNHLVAKILLPHSRPYEDVRKSWERELANLVNLRHPNITYIHDAFECNDTFYLIIERCTYNLEDLINWPDLQPELWIKPVSKSVLQAVHFIHGSGYVHKDIHPRNVFTRHIRSEMGTEMSTTFKIGDLGISRLEPEIDAFNTVFAQWMLAPEFLSPNDFGRIGKPVDIYHAGLLFLSLLLRQIPTFTQEEILQGKPRQIAENLNSPYGSAIAKALRRHVTDRTSCALEFWHDINTSA